MDRDESRQLVRDQNRPLVVGECGTHIEIVNGPALRSKWVGETEAALRCPGEQPL